MVLSSKVRSWSFSMNQAILETVSLEDTDRTIIHGTRSYTGSASVYYYRKLLEAVLDSLVLYYNIIKLEVIGGDGADDACCTLH